MMLDFPLVLWVKRPGVDIIHPQNNKFATSVDKEARGDSELNKLSGKVQMDLTNTTLCYNKWVTITDIVRTNAL